MPTGRRGRPDGNLTACFEGLFDPRTRGVGKALLRAGAVRVMGGSPTRAFVRVRDREDHAVRFALAREGLLTACSCAAYQDGLTCEHVWAALLACARDAHLGACLAHGALDLVYGVGPGEMAATTSAGTGEPGWRELVVAMGHGRVPDSTHLYLLDTRRLREDGAFTITLTTLATDGQRAGPYTLEASIYEALLPRLADSGRLRLWDGDDGSEGRPCAWDDGDPWDLVLEFETPRTGTGASRLVGRLERGPEVLPLEATDGVLAAGFVIAALPDVRLARLRHRASFAWIAFLRDHGAVRVPDAEHRAFRASLLDLPDPPRIRWPDGLEPANAREPQRSAIRLTVPAE